MACQRRMRGAGAAEGQAVRPESLVNQDGAPGLTVTTVLRSWLPGLVPVEVAAALPEAELDKETDPSSEEASSIHDEKTEPAWHAISATCSGTDPLSLAAVDAAATDDDDDDDEDEDDDALPAPAPPAPEPLLPPPPCCPAPDPPPPAPPAAAVAAAAAAALPEDSQEGRVKQM